MLDFWTNEYLLEAIESNVNLADIKRMKWKVYDTHLNSFNLVNRQIVVRFKGNKILDNIKINVVK